MQMYFIDLWWGFVLLAIGSYAIGNINFARIISKAKNKDITKEGSGNPGTMNMSRTFGLKIGILTLVLDILKGVIPSLTAYLVFKGMYFGDSTLEVNQTALYTAGFFVVLGHIFPIIHNFKGGKGIATTIGVFLVGEPIVTLIFAVIALIYIFITAMGSMGSFIVTTPPAIAELIKIYNLGFKNEPSFDYGLSFFVITEFFVIGIILLTWYAHRQNIKRLLAGEEHETGWLDMLHEKRMKKKAAKLKKISNEDCENNNSNHLNIESTKEKTDALIKGENEKFDEEVSKMLSSNDGEYPESREEENLKIIKKDKK